MTSLFDPLALGDLALPNRVITAPLTRLRAGDLPERLKAGAPLNPPRPETFYARGPQGYTDYPALTQAVEA